MAIYFYGCVSLDGYLADTNHGLDWLHESGSPEETDYASFYEQMDVAIMGRRTFDELARAGKPSDFYPSTENYVFTHDETFSAEGFKAVSGSLVDFVRDFPEKNVWIVGGNALLAELLDADLVDVLIVQLAPVLLGAGIPLFTQKEAVKRFELKEVKQYGAFAQLTYEKN